MFDECLGLDECLGFRIVPEGHHRLFVKTTGYEPVVEAPAYTPLKREAYSAILIRPPNGIEWCSEGP